MIHTELSIPLLKDDTAKSFLHTLELSKLKPYSIEERKRTDELLSKLFIRKDK